MIDLRYIAQNLFRLDINMRIIKEKKEREWVVIIENINGDYLKRTSKERNEKI